MKQVENANEKMNDTDIEIACKVLFYCIFGP